MWILRGVIIGLVVLVVNALHGAETDTIELQDVQIIAPASLKTPTLVAQPVDSIYFQSNTSATLGQLLQNGTPVFVKEYGSNGIQTVTFRGMAGGHTGLLLNGLNMNVGSLGMSDFSIFPAYLFSSIDLSYGNAAFSEGDGFFGGAISLRTKFDEIPEGLGGSIMLSMGSFGKQQIGTALQLRRKKWTNETRVIWGEADNDFTYTNTAKVGHPEETQSHAFQSQLGLHESLQYQVNAKNAIYFDGVYSHLERQLPALMTSSGFSEEHQSDRLGVLQLGWTYVGREMLAQTVVGYTHHDLIYQNGQTGLHSVTTNMKWQGRHNLQWEITPTMGLATVVNFTHAKAVNEALAAFNQQDAGSLYAELHKTGRRWKGSFSIKPGFFNSETYVLPMVTFGYKPFKRMNLKVGINGSYNKKFPTLNDLYWVPGGNPNLQPESAWMGEFNAVYQKKYASKTSLSLYGNAYYSDVTNWILWRPSDAGYWMAQNIQAVWSYGAEGKAEVQQTWGKTHWRMLGGYNYVRTNNRSSDPEVRGKQLIYTPANQWNAAIGVTYKKFHVTWYQNYFGVRYTASDNSDYLPAYGVSNVAIGGGIPIAHSQFKWLVQVNNIFDKSYMVVAWRPMMGINGLLTLTYEY